MDKKDDNPNDTVGTFVAMAAAGVVWAILLLLPFFLLLTNLNRMIR